ncbi:UDP-N-acetylglucosamine 2-epimerase (non-hydrolysing) [Arcicella aurantiaca]|uniref:UDP-N-acetylglucosamine 2-epimerase (Non-hydrolysing) n=1 Tax=Arcicella aurantiaca TaxID=591202 RepID=A0A316EFV9_9BACT|nr:UDP-N-acetylglucosamine 2-epimerase (non-hydrolyzing) [Arcicella aurantiaca]PWK28981.1 UDP-N-acetylglucosamine 2-epimerase (non-hydrolysing) [Arcicella aurantiaca]
MIKILNIVGVRPNFMKVAPLHRAFENYPKITSKIVHTGQHYDNNMSDVFFEQLQIPKPDYYLGIGGGSHTEVTAKTMLEFEKVILSENPDLVIVVGDVSATLACALVAKKLHIPVAHVEAGLRSGDHSMPEEVNRMVVDKIADYLFVTEKSGLENLKRDGVCEKKVFFVGNVMIDSLKYYLKKAPQTSILKDLEIQRNNFVIVTMHRPANVDSEKGLSTILTILENTVKHQKVVFPIHPRTAKNIKNFGLEKRLNVIKNLILTKPQGYLEFLQLMKNASLIITDSGGIQEETTFLQVPCLTFRTTTERPVTVEIGTNQLLDDLNPQTVHEKLMEVLEGKTSKGQIPPFWDGKTAERIAEILVSKFTK